MLSTHKILGLVGGYQFGGGIFAGGVSTPLHAMFLYVNYQKEINSLNAKVAIT